MVTLVNLIFRLENRFSLIFVMYYFSSFSMIFCEYLTFFCNITVADYNSSLKMKQSLASEVMDENGEEIKENS